ncbi:phage virion morphogenesis protein [Vibrio sp. 10N.261.55.A7]|uniref:phage virion morphogenesis protein n=1 Tax=Vibrio sp. 10N.261.55.A7 TaxID=1880851 RepID=UPI000C850F95|nr:phage virion morphogenesis protein [Vibrio sp. 10N.261.55.A7]PMJ92855.1 phage virion morphogenesis protein [Vibrio sp. 10N.261.55.A7]
MLQVKADERSFLRAKEQIELLMLDRKTRTRLYRKLGAQLVKKTKANIRAQRNPDGSPWKKRKNGKKKVLQGFTRKVKHFQKNSNRDLYVGWPSARGRVARQHHYGIAERSGLSKRRRQAARNKEPKKTDKATREQAKQLRDLGFRLKPEGRQKRGKKPTLKWMTEHMTVGQAAKTIQELENKTPARDWQIERPERQLIGISPKRMAMMIKKELNRNRSS